MELYELHVGEPHVCAMRDREAIAGRDLRIGRVLVHLATAAGGEHGRIGDDLHRAPGDTGAHAGALPVRHDEVEDARGLEHADALALAHPLDQRAGDLGPRLITMCVHNAVSRMRRFVPEIEIAVGTEVEVGAGDVQLAHPRRPLLHQHRNRRGVAQRRARRQRVLTMERR